MRREGDHGHQQPGQHDPILDHHRELQKTRQTRVAKLLVALFIAIVLIVFIVENSDATRIDYVFFHRQTRLIWIMLVCAILGGVVGYLVGRPGKQVRLRRKPEDDKNKKKT
jgi:uncharacterized integral membrane protein